MKGNNQTDIKERVAFLKKTEIFAELDDPVLEEISEVLIPLTIEKGKIIIRKNSQGQSMFIIVQGEVRIHDGSHVLTRMRAGEVFGEYSLFDEEKRSATATAEQNTKLYKLEQADLFRLIPGNPEITRGLLRTLIKRMRERNILEEKLLKSYLKISKQNKEIETQNESIKVQKQKMEEQNYDLLSLNEEKNHLISVVVHGLKNPLTSSLCIADLINAKQECPDQEQLDILKKSLQRMNGMINQILNVNRIDSKKFRLELEKINLVSITKEVIRNFSIPIRENQLEIKTDFKNTFAKLNETYIYQVIDNLISNAVKYSPKGGEIHLKIYEKNGKARFEIHDQGPGIPRGEHEKIFEKYQRQSVKIIDPDQQSGLGLAIVSKYVRAMRGRVWCESEAGKGASFFIEFDRFLENPPVYE